MHKWIRTYASLGYVGVSVAYRFAPQFKWPAQVQDVKTAVRYLRAHAGELDIDPAHIGVMGESAGGYLALMLGVTSPGDSLEGKSDYPELSSSVQAVVSYFSATDFTLPGEPLNRRGHVIIVTLRQRNSNYLSFRWDAWNFMTRISFTSVYLL
jgi:acetyl esterase/lipase